MVVQLSSETRTLSVFVISPSTQSERAFPASSSIAQVKEKLQLVTGIAASAQRLSLHQPTAATAYELTEGAWIANLEDNGRSLAEYGVKEGDVIKVTPDSSALANSLYTFVEDPNVQKFELTDEEYGSRRDTVMAYKARNKIGRFADAPPAEPTQIPDNLVVNARVKVKPATERDIERVGTVRYVGTTDFAPGVWVGVQYDEPTGKNDGSVEGRQYFKCPPKYGGFIKPERCQVGDWPSLDDELDLDSD